VRELIRPDVLINPLFPNPVVAESLLDRLISTSHQVITNGPSYRPNRSSGS
jgi:DNA replication protein DnaC